MQAERALNSEPPDSSLTFGPVGEHPRPVWNRFDATDPLPDGLPFTTASAVYRYAQAPFLFAIPYTAALTALHPGVAAGVDQHSDFRRNALRRVVLTFDAAAQLASNRPQEVIAMSHAVRRFHNSIQGEYDDRDGMPYVATRYGANDARLQTWVIWCIQRGIEQSYERWIAPMTSDEREVLYRDIRAFGLGFGIPDELLPTDRRALSDYAEQIIQTDVLTGTPTSSNLFREVMLADVPAISPALAVPGRVVRAVSVTFLDDPRLQEHFDIHPTPTDQRIADASDLAIRSSWRHLPQQLRLQAFPAYLAVRRRAPWRMPTPPPPGAT